MSYFPEITSMAEVPRYHAQRRPTKTALVYEGESTDYRTFDKRCSQVANGLVAMGVTRGDRIAWIGKNSADYFELLFGAAKAGVVMVPISWRLAAMEIDYILSDGDVRVLFNDVEFAPVLAKSPAAQNIPKIAMTGSDEFRTWRDAQSSEDLLVDVAPSDIFIQLYTSGTTGHPKGVMLPHGNFFAIEKQRVLAGSPDEDLFEWNLWGPEDVGLITMPCFHISGTGWGVVGLYAGAKNIVMREFSPEGVLNSFNEHGVTKLLLVPTAIQMVLDHPKAATTNFESLKYLAYGASPIPLEILKRAIHTFQCEFVQMYGLTETTGAVTFLPAKDHEVGGNQRMLSAGRPVYGMEMAIFDSEGRRLPANEIGEICVRTPTLMAGYWKLPERTTECIDSEGWFHTGDAGCLDEDGYVYIKDRIKDMIVSGGVNVYPAEIENALYAMPEVAEAAVIGVPDQKWGEAVLAVIVPRDGAKIDANTVMEFCRDRIAGYKIPRQVEVVSALPRNGTGKVMKTELRKPYWSGRERQVG